MIPIRLLMLGICGTALQGEDAKTTIEAIYKSTISALHTAQTKDDIQRMVDAIDVKEWVSSLFDGQTMTRSQATSGLESLLAIPVGNRPTFFIEPFYWSNTAASVTVVYWAYRGAKDSLTGSIARDTWARTAEGWRRTRHEKIIPDQPLVENGKFMLTPSIRNSLTGAPEQQR